MAELLDMNKKLPSALRQQFLWYALEAIQFQRSWPIADRNPEQLTGLQGVFTKSIGRISYMRDLFPVDCHERFDVNIAGVIQIQQELMMEYEKAHKLWGPKILLSVPDSQVTEINRTNEPT